jgi:hypothetical protein
MNAVDATLVRLADPTTRESQFDQEALGQLVDAAYGTDFTGAQGPFTAVFDEFRVGVSAPRIGVIDGVWHKTGSTEQVEARFKAEGFGADGVRVDALWRGAVVARFRVGGEPVENASPRRVELEGIDAEIIADLGALPTDPAALEAARRERLLERLKAAAPDPAAITLATVDRWLDGVGAGSAAELLRRARSDLDALAVTVRFAEPTDLPVAPRPLPVAAVLLVRAAGFSVADLLAESKQVAERLRPLGLEPSFDGAPRPRHPTLVVWVVPASTFDDNGWPGGTGTTPAQQRATRRAAAGRWLAAEGIGLVATPTS